MADLRKIALVTGAGSGIGKDVTLGLARAGHDVVLAGRRPEALEAVAAEAAELGAATLAVVTDIADPAAVGRLFQAIRDRFHRLDLLFNNAGIFTPGVALEDVPFADWKRVVDTNLTGAFLCTQGAFRMMKRQSPGGGRIINNGSISAHAPRPDSVAYTATKHAITGLTKATALDGRAWNIACGQIDIGNAVTDLSSGMVAGMKQADGRIAPEERMDVRHVTDAVLYMAGLPLDANVLTMTVMATRMPFVGRG